MTVVQKPNHSSQLIQHQRSSASQDNWTFGTRGTAGKLPQDRVTLSKSASLANPSKPAGANAVQSQDALSNEQRQIVNELKKRDAEVKAHEQAHMAAGGPVVQGGASYQYQNGPDGRMYAVGGEVKIDVSAERTPDATIRKMQQIRQAALAPSQPSSTDRAVAAQALRIEAQARVEKNDESQLQDQNPPLNPQYSSSGIETPATALESHSVKGRRIDMVA